MQPTQQIAAQVIRRVCIHRDLPDPAERRALRENAGLTQREFAEAIGVSQAAIAHWEVGRRTPRSTWLERYVTGLRALRGAR